MNKGFLIKNPFKTLKEGRRANPFHNDLSINERAIKKNIMYQNFYQLKDIESIFKFRKLKKMG